MGHWCTAMLAADTHFPYEHEKNYPLFIQRVKEINPDRLVLLGDVADMYSISSFVKDPERCDFAGETQYTRDRLTELRDAVGGKVKITIVEGNHERRLGAYMKKNAREFYGLGMLTVPNLWNLAQLKIDYIDNKKLMSKGQAPFSLGGCYLLHGDEIAAGSRINVPRGMYTKIGGRSFVCGHYHQHHHMYIKTIAHKYDEALTIGTLARLTEEDFSCVNHWNCSWAFLKYNTKTHGFYLQTEFVRDNDTGLIV